MCFCWLMLYVNWLESTSLNTTNPSLKFITQTGLHYSKQLETTFHQFCEKPLHITFNTTNPSLTLLTITLLPVTLDLLTLNLLNPHTLVNALAYRCGIGHICWLTAFSPPGQFAPRNKSTYRTVANSLSGPLASCNFCSMERNGPGIFVRGELDLRWHLHNSIGPAIICRCPQQLLASLEIHQQNCEETPHRCR